MNTQFEVYHEKYDLHLRGISAFNTPVKEKKLYKNEGIFWK